MCSIEEAWAGQLFDNKHVQSQSDLHRKYMDIPDGLLQHNNEFSMGYKLPTPRESTRGYESRVPQHLVSNNKANINVSSMANERPQYGGQSPRPEYMSIYDNAENVPMPSMAGKDNFNDINQAYNVSDTVSHFMNRGQHDSRNSNSNSFNSNSSNSSNSFTNHLLSEDNEMDRMILQKKLNSLNVNSESFNNIDNNKNIMQQSQLQNLQFQQALQDIIQRLDRLERDMHQNSTRNMYDMVLYILVGMLIAFIIYSILRKGA